MAKLNQVTPFVVVADVARALEFYIQVLGFSVLQEQAGYAYIRRDSVALRLILASSDKNLQSSDSQQHCYIDVLDLDGLYAELEPELSKLPAGRVRAPFDTGYGMREFHVIDNDVLLISFGEKIQGNP